jgi:predicted nucleic acid-binding protein
LANETAYLDTSVLAHWSVYYRKRKRWREFKENDKARQSMELFHDLKGRKYNVNFCTSHWAIAELYQAALDYRTAVRMIRDGRNPRFFQTQKHKYPLSEREKEDIALSLEAFIYHLRMKKRVVIWTAEHFSYEGVCHFSLRYGIEAPDALHLYLARDLECSYFITVDEPLKDARVEEIKVMFPSTFRNLPIHSRD